MFFKTQHGKVRKGRIEKRAKNMPEQVMTAPAFSIAKFH